MSDFYIYTYCTDVENKIYKQLSSQLDVNVLPVLLPWTWDFYPKSFSLFETIKHLSPEDIILVCDSYDVLPIPNLTKTGLFKSIKDNFDLDKITFNAEKNCYPNADLIHLYPDVNSEWKYLNGGIYVGKVKNVLFMLENLLPKIQGTIDQEVFSIAYIKKEYGIEIDYECKVFQTLYLLTQTDLTIKDNKIVNNKTNSRPSLIHGNGNSGIEKILNYAN